MDEKDLLDSSLAKYIIELSQKEKPKENVWDKIKKYQNYILAISAFIAGILPLYELNTKAIQYFEKKEEIVKLLLKAEELINIDANEEAKVLLNQIEQLEPNNLESNKLNALIDLEELLREKQDVKSLKIIESIYKETLPINPKALYLLGTAYINNDLDKAQKLLHTSEENLNYKNGHLSFLIESAKIWVLSREYDNTGDSKKLDTAITLFNNVITKLSIDSSVQLKEKILIPLYHHYSIVTNQYSKLETGSKWKDTARIYASRAFNLALRSGNYKYIGKTAAGLATEYKDNNQNEIAKKYIEYALNNAELCNDERGIYYNLYTLGQIEFNLRNFTIAKTRFNQSLLKAIKNNDVRLQIYNSIALSKALILLDSTKLALPVLEQAKFLCEFNEDNYGKFECEFLKVFITYKTHKNKKQLYEDLNHLILLAEKANLGEVIQNWVSIVEHKYDKNKLTFNYHFEFEREVIKLFGF